MWVSLQASWETSGWRGMLDGEVDGDRELLFLYERGKKKLLEGNRVEFTGQTNFLFDRYNFYSHGVRVAPHLYTLSWLYF